MKVVIKVGTQSILSTEGTPLESVIVELVEQIAHLKQQGHQAILVSSGAVSFGRKVARQSLKKEFGISIGEKQMLASLGQPELMHIYAREFKKHNLLASQLLLTKQDFQTRQHYLNIARLLHEIFEHENVIPIINENDSVAIQELMFTDNDELAGLIAAQVCAEKLIILSNIEGVYTKNPNEAEARLIPLITKQQDWPRVSSAKSIHGRGGMQSKINTAHKMSTLGITTHIANINQPLVLIRIITNEQLGTTILPSKKKSNFKRWMAYCVNQALGSIIIDDRLNFILKENIQVMSILPVGINKYVGSFQKGDLIDIVSPEGEKIGIGIARYGSEKLQEYCGKKNKPELIHYDQLHLF